MANLPPARPEPPLLTIDKSCIDLGNDEHDVGRVTGSRFTVCFVPYLELPLPWDFILTDLERFYFKHFFKSCGATLTIDERKSCCYHGQEFWDVHCHCEKPWSLQCQAGAKVTRGVCRLAIQGGFYNALFPFYRYVANYHQLRAVRYVGSLFVHGVHLIYLHMNRESDLKYINYNLLGPYKVIDCTLNTWLVLKCTSCKRLNERQARVCARRTRLIIKKICLNIAVDRPKSLRLNHMEPLRQKMFFRLHRYKIAFNHQDYLLTV